MENSRVKVLAIDSVSPAPSLALVEDQGGAFEVLEEEALPAAAAESIAPRVVALLERRGLGASDLDKIAALSGPGSFTGLRSGAAFARGLARSVSRPLVAVTTFEAASALFPEPRDTVFLLDAGRGDVHRARRAGASSATLAEEARPVSRAEVLHQAGESGALVVDLDVERLLLAAAAGRIAASREDPASFRPVYGRVSAAEEKMEGR
ncbi:MAG TPA: tRNA (adenosine(37)-N6)-threonylcarbamoyltransferase complex dimerization subunit type 1 TsaB [Thermoanaerobaculia bacterium]|nr:tRNA (adenosine(37)-N6)-threonylcarbamoyltransferase complex dimerization subunit type 1 TsaB [Thermoanaerobaculia bacterium]